jgi:Heavy metal binding domain
MRKALLSLAFMPLTAACVSTNVDVPRDHPANPSAPVAQLELTPALVTTAASAEATVPVGHQRGHDHGGHDHEGHDRQVPTPAASATLATSAAPPAAVPAPPARQADQPAAEVWTCPMHPDVVKSGPGQCPICGMNLVKRSSGKGSK